MHRLAKESELLRTENASLQDTVNKLLESNDELSTKVSADYWAYLLCCIMDLASWLSEIWEIICISSLMLLLQKDFLSTRYVLVTAERDRLEEEISTLSRAGLENQSIIESQSSLLVDLKVSIIMPGIFTYLFNWRYSLWKVQMIIYNTQVFCSNRNNLKNYNNVFWRITDQPIVPLKSLLKVDLQWISMMPLPQQMEVSYTHEQVV